MCSKCRNGVVLAESKGSSIKGGDSRPGLYAFRCNCNSDFRNRAYPVFDNNAQKEFISVLEHEAPTLTWMYEQIELNLTKSEAFQKKLETWGRAKFEYLYFECKQYKLKLTEKRFNRTGD